jgi:hypothetical protein
MQTDQFWIPGSRYRVMGIGVALLAAIILWTARASLSLAAPMGFVDSLYRFADIVDVPLALMTTLGSFLVFSGLWAIVPETKFGAWAVRGVIAFLVVLNLLVWGVAVWLR